jgi:predicted RNA-binding protein with PIN domain
MSLHYILDGYNIIKQIPPLKLKSLKSSRDSLTRFIERYRPQGSQRNKITIVFDGHKDVVSYESHYPVDVFFTKGETADDRIRKMVQHSKNAKGIVVVTDDRELGLLVRSMGARVISVEDFLGRAKKDTKVVQDEKPVSHSAKLKITKELERIWLKQDAAKGKR